MTYETFVAYSSITIVTIITIAILYRIDKDGRESMKQRAKFENYHKQLLEYIRRAQQMDNGDKTLAEIDKYHPIPTEHSVSPCIKPQKPKRRKPEWWRFLTEESIGSLLKKRRQRKKEAKARANDPWASL